MSSAASEFPRREPLAAAVARSAALGALAGAAVGFAETARVLAGYDARVAAWAATTLAIAGAFYALAGAALAGVAALAALALHGRPQHRAASPSSCAALGATAALATFAGTAAFDAATLLPAALAGTLLAIALREILAWWPLFTRARTWGGLAGLALALDVAIVAVRWCDGALRWVLLLLAAVNTALSLAALLGKRAAHCLTAGAVAVAASIALPAPARELASAPSSSTDVLLVTIDTLRADHLGCYGRQSAHTPAIDALAAEGVLFEDATAQANTTGPSHTTILTGLYPAQHGLLSNGMHLSNRARTLADALRDTHASAAFVSGFTLVNESCGLAPRFDRYDDQLLAWKWMPRLAERLHLVKSAIRACEERGVTVRRSNRPAGETVDRALAWLRDHADVPKLTWVHLFDPHAPYEPPAEFAERSDPGFAGSGGFGPGDFDWYEMETEVRERLVADERALRHMHALYAAEISYADSQVARLIDELRRTGRLERTLVVLASDHGESLGDHGVWFDHGTYLYEPELHVPLIVRFPGAVHAGTRVKEQVRLLDVAPSVLEFLGESRRLQPTGASFLALARGERDATDRAAYALSDIAGSVSGFDIGGRRLALRTRGIKLIWSSPHWIDTARVPEALECYDLARDPGELEDLSGAADAPSDLEHLKTQLGAWREATASIERGQELSGDVLEQLRKLGYL
jgi:arylsulfatase A-like enzyme